MKNVWLRKILQNVAPNFYNRTKNKIRIKGTTTNDFSKLNVFMGYKLCHYNTENNKKRTGHNSEIFYVKSD